MTDPQTPELAPPAAELIRCEGVSKLLYADEAEAHAVSASNLAISGGGFASATGRLDLAGGARMLGLLGELHKSGAAVRMVTRGSRYARGATRALQLPEGRLAEKEVAG